MQLPEGYLNASTVYWTAHPQPVICPYCHSTTTSTVKYVSGAATWLSCIGICLLGGGIGCCLIPFCVNPLKDCDHFCSNCDALIHRKTVF